MVFNATFLSYFSYIVAISFIGGGNRSNAESHRPAASHWQTLSHNVVSSTPRHQRDSNSCGFGGKDWYDTHLYRHQWQWLQMFSLHMSLYHSQFNKYAKIY